MCIEYYEIDLSENDNISKAMQLMMSEADKKVFMNNTDSERVRKAMVEIRTYPPKITETEKGEALEYDFRKTPNTTEYRNHAGYVIHNGNDISEMFCDCRDFFYRLWAPMVNAGYAKWDVPAKYQHRVKAHIRQGGHNHQWTKVTNKPGVLYVCKHLYALMLEYVDSDIRATPITRKSKKVAQKIKPEKGKTPNQIKRDIANKKEIEKAKKLKGEVPTDMDEPIDKKIHTGTDDKEDTLNVDTPKNEPQKKPDEIDIDDLKSIEEPDVDEPDEDEPDEDEPKTPDNKLGTEPKRGWWKKFFDRPKKFFKRNRNESFAMYYNRLDDDDDK